MDELEQKISILTSRIDELEGRVGKNEYSNTKIEYKEVIQKTSGYQSENFVTGASGWRFDSEGNLEANNGNFRGDITGASGSFSGSVTATSGTIGGWTIASTYLYAGSGTNTVGLSATEGAGDDIRFWAGDTYANRGSAPLRITESGNGYFSGDIYVSNINMTGGTFINTAATLAESRLNTLFKRTIFIGSSGDGLVETAGAGGTITRYLMITSMTGATNLTWCTLGSAQTSGGGLTVDSEYIATVSVNQTTNQNVFWGMGDDNSTPADSVLTIDHYGFIIDDATLYASNADGATQTKTDISSGITLTNYNTYRIVHDVGVNIKFYINDALVATHTTNLPNTGAPKVWFCIERSGGAGDKVLNVLNSYTFIQSTVA